MRPGAPAQQIDQEMDKKNQTGQLFPRRVPALVIQ